MALRVLINDPLNESAERWKNKARAAFITPTKKKARSSKTTATNTAKGTCKGTTKRRSASRR